jgi:hypothetical protein
MSVEGFDGHVEDFELALGHVTGVRGFKVDDLGRLTGVTIREVFRPGPNTATCVNGCGTKNLANCSCGYYAYFGQDGEKYFYSAEIGAIIRGYGRTIVGTKGFRAEKADLLALFPMETVPAARAKAVPVRRPSKLRFLYPKASWFLKPITRGLDGLALAFNVFLVSWFITGVPKMFVSGLTLAASLSLLIGVPLSLWIVGFLRRTWWGGLARIDLKYPSLPMRNVAQLNRLCKGDVSSLSVDPASSNKKFSEALSERLGTLYPGVPQYATFQQAVEDHPLTPPDEHQPPPSELRAGDTWGSLVADASRQGSTPSYARGGFLSNSGNNPYTGCGCSLCQAFNK